MKRITFILGILFLLSCEKDSFNESYRYLYGDWVPVQLSAGLGYSIKPELLGDLIQILRNGSYKIFRNEKAVETGKIDIETQTEGELSLKFVAKEIDWGSDSFVRLSRSTLYLKPYTQDSILLFNLAVDGGHFGLVLRRKY